jgi:NADH-quinone oxidoreductase subunit M
MLRRVTHGEASPAVSGVGPAIARAEWIAWAPLVLLALAVGLIPAAVLNMARTTVAALASAVGR